MSLTLFSLLFLTLSSSSVFSHSIPHSVVQDYLDKRKLEPPKEPIIGFRSLTHNQELPLKGLKYNIEISNSLAEVTISQEYVNPFSENIETEYFFSISPTAAFVSLSAELDGKIIQGRVKEKEQAKSEYKEAISQGKRAAYAEIVKELHDIMKLKLGNLGAHQRATIKLVYLEPLDVAMNRFWKFSLGNTFSSRSIQQQNPSEDLKKDCNPNVIPSSSPQVYTFDLDLHIVSPTPITFINSPSHDIKSSLVAGSERKDYKLSLKNQIPNKQFLLLFKNENFNRPQVSIGKNELSKEFPYAAYVTFFPDFGSTDTDDVIYKDFKQRYHVNQEIAFQDEYDPNMKGVRGEYIFVVDRSGSMNGDRIAVTREVLSKLISMLPQDSYFNVISFGSNYQLMFSKSKHKAEAIDSARSQIQSFQADLGGTEIYSPLQEIFENMPMLNNYPRNVFLLTDGQVSDEDNVINLIRRHSERKNLRVYSVGIGNGVSENLIKESAREGKGKYDIIAETSQLESRVKILLKDSITPFLDQFQIQFDENKISAIVPHPLSIKSVRKNEQMNFFVLLADNFDKTDITMNCYDSISDQVKQFTVTLDSSKAVATNVIHQMAIHKQIKTMLFNAIYFEADKDIVHYYFTNKIQNIYEKILQLSVDYQVLSELTAFVLVDEEIVEKKEPIKISIPVIESVDYGMGIDIRGIALHPDMKMREGFMQMSGGVRGIMPSGAVFKSGNLGAPQMDLSGADSLLLIDQESDGSLVLDGIDMDASDKNQQAPQEKSMHYAHLPKKRKIETTNYQSMSAHPVNTSVFATIIKQSAGVLRFSLWVCLVLVGIYSFFI